MNSNAITDERGAMPSASRMTRIFNCPASFKLNLMETPETSDAAKEGTLLHRAMELSIKSKSPAEAKELSEIDEQLNDEQKTAIMFALKVVQPLTMRIDHFTTERRLWANSKLFSGQGDLILFDKPEHAIIIDYKFGHGEVEPAERNYQLAAMAVLIADNYREIKNVEAVIIQPRALERSKRITKCEYSERDIDSARVAITNACKEATATAQPRQKCGYWCNYCASSYRCKEAQLGIAQQYALATATPNLAITAENAKELFEKASVVKKHCDALISAIKDFVVANPENSGGLTLDAGTRRSKIGNANEVFSAVEIVGISPEEFVGCCDVGMAKLQTLFHAKRKLANEKQTKKASDLEVKDLLESKGLLTYTQTAPTLKVVEEA